MNPTPSMLQFHISHQAARRRMQMAGARRAALDAAKERAAREALHQAQQQAVMDALMAEAEAENEQRDAIRRWHPIPLVLDVIAKAHGYTREDLQSVSHRRPVVRARQHAAATLRGRGWSLKRISEALRRDRSTILHSCRRWQTVAAQFPNQVAAVHSALGGIVNSGDNLVDTSGAINETGLHMIP